MDVRSPQGRDGDRSARASELEEAIEHRARELDARVAEREDGFEDELERVREDGRRRSSARRGRGPERDRGRSCNLAEAPAAASSPTGSPTRPSSGRRPRRSARLGRRDGEAEAARPWSAARRPASGPPRGRAQGARLAKEARAPKRSERRGARARAAQRAAEEPSCGGGGSARSPRLKASGPQRRPKPAPRPGSGRRRIRRSSRISARARLSGLGRSRPAGGGSRSASHCPRRSPASTR